MYKVRLIGLWLLLAVGNAFYFLVASWFDMSLGSKLILALILAGLELLLFITSYWSENTKVEDAFERLVLMQVIVFFLSFVRSGESFWWAILTPIVVYLVVVPFWHSFGKNFFPNVYKPVQGKYCAFLVKLEYFFFEVKK